MDGGASRARQRWIRAGSFACAATTLARTYIDLSPISVSARATMDAWVTRATEDDEAALASRSRSARRGFSIEQRHLNRLALHRRALDWQRYDLLMESLLERGGDPPTTMLIYAKHGMLEAVERMIDAGLASCNERDPCTGETALHLACRNDDAEMVGALLSRRDLDPFRQNCCYEFAVHCAIERENVRALVACLESGKIRLDTRLPYRHPTDGRKFPGSTLLHTMCCMARFSTIDASVRAAAQADASLVLEDLLRLRSHAGNTPIHFALKLNSRDPRLVDLLLRLGSSVLARDDDGWSCLHYAALATPATAASRSILERIVEAIRERHGLTRIDHRGLAERLNRMVTRHGGYGALSLAVCLNAENPAQRLEFGNDIVELLLDLGLDVDQQDRQGVTALHVCKQERDVASLALRLPRLDLLDKWGRTAYVAMAEEDAFAAADDDAAGGGGGGLVATAPLLAECVEQVSGLTAIRLNASRGITLRSAMLMNCHDLAAYAYNVVLYGIFDGPQWSNFMVQFPRYRRRLFRRYVQAFQRRCLLEAAKQYLLRQSRRCGGGGGGGNGQAPSSSSAAAVDGCGGEAGDSFRLVLANGLFPEIARYLTNRQLREMIAAAVVAEAQDDQDRDQEQEQEQQQEEEADDDDDEMPPYPRLYSRFWKRVKEDEGILRLLL